MKKRNPYILVLFFCVLFLTSCFKTPDRTYIGAAVVEFKNHRAGFSAALNTSILNVTNGVANRSVRQTIGNDTVFVQLVGAQLNQAIDVNYQVDATSTAIENTHYRFPASKGVVTIPANSSVGYLLIQTLPGITSATETRAIVFTLLGASNEIKPSENYKIFTYTIRQ